MATSDTWHESYERMSEGTKDFARAVKSLQEELEAVGWYHQRAEATEDTQLKRILEHNRDEEIEHAMMALEYLRRRHPAFDRHMRTYLFSNGDIVSVEEDADAQAQAQADAGGQEHEEHAHANPAPSR